VARSYVREARRRVGPKRERIGPIVERLAIEHADAKIALEFRTDLELLVSVMLSAQTTDVNVNRVTERLFEKYRRPEDYLAVPQEELERDIYQTGFFRQKTKSLRGVSQALIERHGGEVPLTMRELIALPGVARKTANVVLGAAAPEAHRADREAGIAVDTHVKRLSRRFAFTKSDDPVKIERDLMKLLPKEVWPSASLSIILHGRRVCDAQRPRCLDCIVEDLCPSSLAAGRRDLAGQAKAMGRTGVARPVTPDAGATPATDPAE
jgi:endonuclease III